MFDLICVTARSLCREPFLNRVARLAAAHPGALLLREKDLSASAYQALAEQVLRLCRAAGTPCILHGFPAVAAALGVDALHLPLPQLRALKPEQRRRFARLGASCHSLAEAQEAQALGCTYLTAGHIFETGCKPGLPGRGLDFLREVCAAVDIPVYAIGGVTAENLPLLRDCGAAGACVMSEAMRADDPAACLAALKGACL